MNIRHAAALALMSVVLSASSVRADDGCWFLACDRSSTAMQCQGARRMAFNPVPAGGSYQRGTASKLEAWVGTIATVPILGELHHQLCSGLGFSVGTTRLSTEKSTADTSIILTQNTGMPPGRVVTSKSAKSKLAERAGYSDSLAAARPCSIDELKLSTRLFHLGGECRIDVKQIARVSCSAYR